MKKNELRKKPGIAANILKYPILILLSLEFPISTSLGYLPLECQSFIKQVEENIILLGMKKEAFLRFTTVFQQLNSLWELS
jgi:hypothetical protein